MLDFEDELLTVRVDVLAEFICEWMEPLDDAALFDEPAERVKVLELLLREPKELLLELLLLEP